MSEREFSRSVNIAAPLPLVWSVMVDVEHSPEWTASVSRVKRLTPGPLKVGSRFRIHQPKLPPALWRVTELVADSGFTWISRAPGVRVTARHTAEAIALGTLATLSIRYEGFFGTLLARYVGDLNDRYLDLEANGLKSRCLQLAANRTHEHEIH